MKKPLRVVLVVLLNIVSLVIIVVSILPLRALLRFALHPDFPKLVEQDYSAIWAYQAMAMRPIGLGATVVCAVWSVVLWIFRMRISTWIFIFLTIINLLVTFAGLPVASSISARKIASRKTVEALQPGIVRKREEARQKLSEISKFNLHEQRTILTTLNFPEDSSLIPEWEAFGKRVVNFVPDDKMRASRQYLLGDAIEALGRYHNNPEALAAIEAIEKELRETSAPKEKILFSTVFINKQKAVNPPYQILSEAVIARQAEMKRIHLEAEGALEDLRLSGNLVQEGRNLVTQKRYGDALEKYRQALSAPFVSSEADAMDVGRGFVDALILAGESDRLEDWETAIQWQKLVLKKGIGIQWINKEIIKLWKLYESYSDQRKKRNLPIDPNLVEWSLKVDVEGKKKELEEKYKRFDDKSHLFWDLGDYYYRNLNYERAEQVLLDGIKYVKDWNASGKPINQDRHMEEHMFRDVLKNLYVIMGRYDEAIKQVEEIKSVVAQKPKDRYYSKPNRIIFNEKYDHYVLALKYARDHKVPPRELKYVQDLDYSFIEFDAPGWVTWNQKYKELWPRVKDMK